MIKNKNKTLLVHHLPHAFKFPIFAPLIAKETRTGLKKQENDDLNL
jgi:hypothetical protein